MIRKSFAAALALLLAGGWSAQAVDETADASKGSLGGKLWMVSSDYADDTVMFGPTAGLELGNDFWISAMGLFGEFEYGEGDYSESDQEVDAEAVVGKRFHGFDLGVGVRYVTVTTKYEDTYYAGYGRYDSRTVSENVAAYGPMLYAGFGELFTDSPLGWYAGGSWVPKTSGDFDAPHYNLEGGLFGVFARWTVTAGYRMRTFYDGDEDVKFTGLAFSGAYGF